MKRRRSILVALVALACVRAAAAQVTPGEDIPEWQAWVRVTQIHLEETGNAQLTGGGFSLRLRIRWLGMAAWFDVVTGHDEYDTRRTELDYGSDFLFYLNRHAAVRLVGVVGFGGVAVSRSERWTDERTQDRELHTGLGFELAVTKRMAIEINGVVFHRSLANSEGVKQDPDDQHERVPVGSYGFVLRAGTGLYF